MRKLLAFHSLRLLLIAALATPEVPSRFRGNSNNEVYLKAVSTQSGRDLVEEFIAAGIWLLSDGWGFKKFVEKTIPLISGSLLFPVFEVDPDYLNKPDFADFVESRALLMVGKYTLAEHNAITKKLSHRGHLNRVFIQYRIQYSQHMAPLAPVRRRGAQIASKASLMKQSLPTSADTSVR